MNTKTIFTICLLLLGTMALQAQELKYFRDNYGKYGYKDQSGKIVVEPKYDRAYNFSEGLAMVELNKKWGFIDEKGKEIAYDNILGFKYDYVLGFSEGLAAVKKNVIDLALWGFIDKTGKEVTEFIYRDAKPFSDGFALIKDAVGVFNYIDKDFNFLIKERTEGTFDFSKFIVPERIIMAESFSEGMAAVKLMSLKESEEDRWGFINKKGEIAIPAKYDGVRGGFKEGLSAVNIGGIVSEIYLGIERIEGGKWGFINQSGTDVIPPVYEDVRFFDNGLAQVKQINKWGYIDKTGKIIVPLEYDVIYGNFRDGKVEVKKDGRTFFIDKTGKEIEDDNAVFNKMATAYQSGNFAEAFKLAEQLANKHNADAMNLLGNMYAQGQGTKQNYGMARSWWEMASNKGNAAATGNIGLLYAQGWGVPQNMAEAEKWFKKGADLGDPQSVFNLGNLAFQKGNLTEARQWIQKAKTAGHPQADAALQQINAASANQQQHRRDKN